MAGRPMKATLRGSETVTGKRNSRKGLFVAELLSERSLPA